MKRFSYDFSGFVLGAALCSVPICMVIDSIFSPLFATERAVRNGSGDWEGVVTLPSGAPNALSLPGNPVLHTGESAASAHSSGLADYRPVSIRMERSADLGQSSFPFRVGTSAYQAPGSVDGSLQGVSSDEGGAAGMDPRLWGRRTSEKSVSARISLWSPSEQVGRLNTQPGAGIKSGRHLQVSLLREIKHDMADAAARLCGVPTGLFRALIARESSWRWQTSHKGAVGLTQVMPIVARTFPSLDVNTGWGNLLAGACWLRMEFDTYKDPKKSEWENWARSLYSYHAGRGRVLSVSASYVEDIMEGGGM